MHNTKCMGCKVYMFADADNRFFGEINAAAHITVWKNICIFAANEMLFILYW